jgi:hypothetical protein
VILPANGITESSRVVRSEIVTAGYILSVSYADQVDYGISAAQAHTLINAFNNGMLSYKTLPARTAPRVAWISARSLSCSSGARASSSRAKAKVLA